MTTMKRSALAFAIAAALMGGTGGVSALTVDGYEIASHEEDSTGTGDEIGTDEKDDKGKDAGGDSDDKGDDDGSDVGDTDGPGDDEDD